MDLEISKRRNYAPGAGQLCRNCCLRLYGTDDLRTLPDFAGEFP